MVVRGDVSGEEDILVHGRVEGTVTLRQNSLTIGRDGRVKAEVRAKNVVVEGEVEGDVVAEERITIRQSAHVRGNIVAPRVILEDGAKFKGTIDMEPQQGQGAAKPRPVEMAIKSTG